MTVEEPQSTTTTTPSTTTTTTRGGLAVGPGQIVAVIGAIAVGVSCFLDWLSSGEGVPDRGASSVPFDILWDSHATSGTSILVWLIPIAVAILVGALVPQLRPLALIGGIAAIVVGVLYMVQLQDLLNDAGLDASFTDHVGVGAYVAVGGGVLGIVGAVLPRSSTA